jgi:hypothetical protein
MNSDDRTKQTLQSAAGQFLALSAAVHALIETHPDPAALKAALMRRLQPSDRMLLTDASLMADQGIGEAYGMLRQSILSAFPDG